MRQSTATCLFVVLFLVAAALSTPGAARGQGTISVPSAYGDYYFGKNKVQFENFKWEIYHSPHFDVYYYTDDEELLQKVVSFAESAYDQLSQEFDFQIKKPTSLIFYETHAHFEQNNEISNFIPEGVGAFATPVRYRMFLPVDLPDPELYELILHELTHIFQYHMLFGGNLGKGLAGRPPNWVMEGMASYMEGEESARDKMFVRDAVVNDRVPAITQSGVGGFFAYRFGYSVFEYIEYRWGPEGMRDFIVELRNTVGGRVGRAVERAFGLSPEEFDADFRRWLRKRYLAELLETGEPGDFGRPFRAHRGIPSQNTSPVASPSGDFVAAFTNNRGDVDVVLYETQDRTFFKNLTKGYSGKYQYYVAQELTMGRKTGRDLAFSPDGNSVAFFARKNRGRELVILDVLSKKIRHSVAMDVGQQFSPAWSPDGSKIAFSGWRDGRYDIFEIDTQTGEITNLTDDDIYDGAPTYAPDGESIVLTSVVGGYEKLFRIYLNNPQERVPLREGIRTKTNETDAVFSPNGNRLYFTSDASGANNIFSFDFDTGVIQQHTNSVTGCFMPTVLAAPDGKDRLVFTAFWKGQFDLYMLDVEDPITDPTIVTEDALTELQSLRADQLPRFEPSIEVSLDDANKSRYRGFKFRLENIFGGQIGVSDDQTFVAQIGFEFVDYLGDRRIFALFESVSSFQNFDVFYVDNSKRLSKILRIYDNRDFFAGFNTVTGQVERIQSALRLTGIAATVSYPFGVNHRISGGLGYVYRDIDYQQFLRDPDGNVIIDPETGFPIPIVSPRTDNYPQLEAALVGDSTVFANYGPIAGRRFRLFGSYAPNLTGDDKDEDSTLTATYGIDFRQYLSTTRRTNFAWRLWGASSNGAAPTPLYIGGLDTIRGFEFRSLVGDRAFFSNLEWRFPLIDYLVLPGFAFQQIRGVLFLDVGGAWYSDVQSFQFWNSEEDRLEDAVSSYGFGVSLRLFGLMMNWDFVRQWDFATSAEGWDTSFWIGRRF